MNYQKVWDKVLSKEEKVKFSFSIGEGYLNLGLIISIIVSIPLMFVFGIGVLVLLFSIFYFSFYLKVANAYAFTDKRVVVYRGWLSTNTISIDYSKITDVRVRQAFFDRILTKTGDLAINTAGSNHVEVVLRHIKDPYEVKKILDEIRG